jgi:hypothetical protein
MANRSASKRPFANHAQASKQRLNSKLRRWQSTIRIAWFAILMASVCLEGLGRRYLRAVPPAVFYFTKDVVLLFGLICFTIRPEIKDIAKKLYGMALFPLGLGVVWTILECFNPMQGSLVLAVVGVRAYWLWWLSPLVIANVLHDGQVRRAAVYILALTAVPVCVFAVVQFGSPPEADVNTYSVTTEGDLVQAVAIEETGRARVSSTFSFITGFSDFTIIVPALLMTIGLGDPDRKIRLVALSATVLTAAVLPMSGSRAPVVVGACMVTIIAWSAGFLFTKAGRRLIIGGIVLVAITLTAFPAAMDGVFNRLQSGDSQARFDDTLNVLPPIALQSTNYPWMGIGTGMQQNVRAQLGVSSYQYNSEHEAGKQLIELGIPGYMLYWFARLGICLALIKASRILRRDSRGAAAGAAMGFAALTLFGNLIFDHIWQALFFIAIGYILLETNVAYRSLRSRAVPIRRPGPTQRQRPDQDVASDVLGAQPAPLAGGLKPLAS